MRSPLICTLLVAVYVSACSDQENNQAMTMPAPHEITRDAIGYYCSMIVVDHLGPKGQVHVSGRDEPVWFSSVRDTIVFTLLPEEPKNIAAIYVNDMGRASWDRPEPGTWIDAREAWFVIGSNRVGGMGAPEAVPFADKGDAELFADRYGGEVVAFTGVPEAYVLSDASQAQHAGMSRGMGETHHPMPVSSGVPANAAGDSSMAHAHGNSGGEVVK